MRPTLQRNGKLFKWLGNWSSLEQYLKDHEIDNPNSMIHYIAGTPWAYAGTIDPKRVVAMAERLKVKHLTPSEYLKNLGLTGIYREA